MAVAEPYAPTAPSRLRSFSMGVRRPGASTVALVLLGAVTLLAVLGPVLAPHDTRAVVGEQLAAPSWSHPMGTDEIGRDVFSRVLVGWQASWFGALAVIASGVVVGGLVGVVAGYWGGILDSVLMRITDVFLALPGTILAVALVAALGRSYTNALLGVALVWWPLYARLVRSEVRRYRAAPHLDAARLAGVGNIRLMRRHLLPGTLPVVLIAASFDVAGVVLTLAGLSFLGLGAPAPAPELGAMTSRGIAYIYDSWWVALMPAFGVFVMALVANFSGDALRDRLTDR